MANAPTLAPVHRNETAECQNPGKEENQEVVRYGEGQTPSEGLRRPTLSKADVSRLGSQFLAPLIAEQRRCITGDRFAMAEPGGVE